MQNADCLTCIHLPIRFEYCLDLSMRDGTSRAYPFFFKQDHHDLNQHLGNHNNEGAKADLRCLGVAASHRNLDRQIAINDDSTLGQHFRGKSISGKLVQCSFKQIKIQRGTISMMTAVRLTLPRGAAGRAPAAHEGTWPPLRQRHPGGAQQCKGDSE
jgi:hypothetical protein